MDAEWIFDLGCIFPVEDNNWASNRCRRKIFFLIGILEPATVILDLKIRSSQNLLEFERTSGHKTAGFWVNHSTIGMFHDLTHCCSGECGAKGQRAGSCPRDAWFMWPEVGSQLLHHQDSKKGGLEDVIQIEEANKPTKRHLQRASTSSLAILVVLECNDLKHFTPVDSWTAQIAFDDWD